MSPAEGGTPRAPSTSRGPSPRRPPLGGGRTGLTSSGSSVGAGAAGDAAADVSPDPARGGSRIGTPEAAEETLQGAVAVALRKELFQLWVTADLMSFSAGLVDLVTLALAAPLTERLIAAAVERLPALRGLAPDSQMPEVHTRAAHGGGTPAQLTELMEELRGFLSSHDLLAGQEEARTDLKRGVAAKLATSHPWQRWLSGGCSLLLPAGTVLSFVAAVAPLILAAGFAGVPGATARAAEDSESEGQAFDKEAAKSGIPAGLASARRCRRRIFALERELIARDKAEQERRKFEKAERDQVHQRLMDINKQLEEKLKARTEELKRAGQKIIEAQRGVDDARAQLSERRKEVAQLRYQLEQDVADRRVSAARELEHNRAVLRAAARESLARQRGAQRAERLRRCLEGEAAAELVREASPDPGKVNLLITQIEAEVEAKMVKRKEMYDAALRDFEDRIERKRQEYKEVCRQLREVTAACRLAASP